MIEYKTFTLDNGLKVFVHEDPSTQVAVLNILYNVGARDEDENKTGFAHLFEHLMFGGSKNVTNFDEPLERVGGENNAFTNNDITNYYLSLPANNIETGFWLESDRMIGLSFDPKVLEIQKNVVIEEFKQRYLNQPYGDVWLKLRPLAYKKHPYKWPTIGKDISHIEEATMDDVKSFFYKFYVPNNAILVVAGNVNFDQIVALSEKWFGPIPAGKTGPRQLPEEPDQNEPRLLETEERVPSNVLYKAYHMPGRFDERFHSVDLLSDILGRGKSSRLYQKLVKEKDYFSSINAYVIGSVDPGLLVINGTLNEDVEIEKGDEAIKSEIALINKEIMEQEVEKVKNQAESTLIFSEVEVLHRAMGLAYGSLSGDRDWINKEPERIRKVTVEDILNESHKILVESNCSTLYYRSKNGK